MEGQFCGSVPNADSRLISGGVPAAIIVLSRRDDILNLLKLFLSNLLSIPVVV